MTSKSRFTQEKKVLICLEHLFMGGTLTVGGLEYILGDDNNLSAKGLQASFDISLSNLIRMFGNIPDEEYISIAASVTFTKLRREKYNRLF